MASLVVYEDEHASIVYGHNPIALGHLKIYPKVKVSTLDDLPAKVISHLFSLATRCASLLFDGLQAQGTNIILNEGKNANQQDDNICIDVIARAEKDELSFVWQPKQGDMEQIKQIASEISSKIIVYEKPVDKKVESQTQTQKAKEKQNEEEAVSIKVQPSPEEFGMDAVNTVEVVPFEDPVVDKSMIIEGKKPEHKEKVDNKPKRVTDEEFDKKTNFLFYELMRMP